MSKEKHTPGPWRWVGHNLMQDVPTKYPLVNTSGDKEGKETNPYSTPCGYPIADDGSAAGEYGPTIDTDGPDARLIAAAPELLEACKEAFIRMPMTKHNEGINKMLKSAIAKAEGRNQ